MKQVHYKEIDFDKELSKGGKVYNKKVGQWWYQQAHDSAHVYAYRNIADQVRSLFTQEPRLIIDYACGPGNLLSRLCLRFPESRFVAIDGSSFMLRVARDRLKRLGRGVPGRVTLVQSKLPNFSLPEYKADLLLFAFPNIVATTDEQPYYDQHGYRKAKDAAAARYLSRARDKDSGEEKDQHDPDVLCDSLLTAKVISRNIRGLLKKGGICLRVEYANGRLDQLSRLAQQRSAFEEGSLKKVKGYKPKQLFKLLHSSYFRSRVMEDVYHQTRDKTDQKGGYLINVLRAI